MLNWLNSLHWVKLYKGNKQWFYVGVMCRSHMQGLWAVPEWFAFINGKGLTIQILSESNVGINW